MSSAAGVFVLTDPSTLVAMQSASFASEDDFQNLLAKFPALLAGDQIDSANPRRFMLVAREHPIADELGGSGRWSLDHLFLDQDGVPTLVEVKRGTDTRIRREVVGQMLEYAANAISYWPMEELRERFVGRCLGSGKDPVEVMKDSLGTGLDPDAYWGTVKAHLQLGHIRMLFVADRIPPELRKIVEFLNAQMMPAEVLAVELRQFQGGGLSALSPIVFGQTQQSIEVKSTSSVKPRRVWDEARFMTQMASASDPARVGGTQFVMEWIKAKADRVAFNDAPSWGSMGAEFKVGADTCVPVRVWTDGTVQIFFNQLLRTKAFAEISARQDLMNRLNALPGVALRPDALDRQPWFPVALLIPDKGVAFFQIMEGVIERLRAEGAVVKGVGALHEHAIYHSAPTAG